MRLILLILSIVIVSCSQKGTTDSNADSVVISKVYIRTLGFVRSDTIIISTSEFSYFGKEKDTSILDNTILSQVLQGLNHTEIWEMQTNYNYQNYIDLDTYYVTITLESGENRTVKRYQLAKKLPWDSGDTLVMRVRQFAEQLFGQ